MMKQAVHSDTYEALFHDTGNQCMRGNEAQNLNIELCLGRDEAEIISGQGVYCTYRYHRIDGSTFVSPPKLSANSVQSTRVPRPRINVAEHEGVASSANSSPYSPYQFTQKPVGFFVVYCNSVVKTATSGQIAGGEEKKMGRWVSGEKADKENGEEAWLAKKERQDEERASWAFGSHFIFEPTI
ncbi:hypothetical protein SODALDRAFT_375179 [Sodiomyces alkalinus F11]|uniref:Uncharacterized protein n=1 Tax=Sodiomyces alkalinus (strain CBS 110278 / VKM F-3762 / F11) TaxID=1314773 RepID=A0A3N2Q875_SODAK|nr:hypothetical protein SODALDRAFT_375179 [Sodiomyces alkalinus F11]ROT42940.1 hypothetical protein SODALDRAFT_375179 [Sodiomyces alkalinus F11]